MHLITHSWGTVILFDILFANRWDDPTLPGFSHVQKIRQAIFGLSPHEQSGIRLASISTMGSPLALFSLITIIGSSQGGSTHDITPNLEELFSRLIINEQKMPWLNFTHPGEPIAYPLEKVLPNLVDPQHKFIDIEDVLTSGSGWLEFISRPLAGSFLSLMNGGNAHLSYWESKLVAERIAEII